MPRPWMTGDIPHDLIEEARKEGEGLGTIFCTKCLDGRIDDPAAGWKGKGLAP